MITKMQILAFAVLGMAIVSSAVPIVEHSAVQRRVRIEGRRFVLTATNETLVMSGPNVVVKGPPYLPSVDGDAFCTDEVNESCTATGTCKTCTTFNEADVAHLKAMGWNTIRLGVVWAGAQPRDENALDPDFVRRLQAILSLCDRSGIHVILDNHGDMVGTAGCGNGVPMWFQQKAAPHLIGKALRTEFPFSLVPSLEISRLPGYSHCGEDDSKWAAHAGDPNYNLLNECCQQLNSPNPGALGYTTISQETMHYLVKDGPGRADFVRFWELLAVAVRDHPSAFAAELMNEPMTIRRREMFDTWRAVAEAINTIIPDMSVSVADVGEGAVLPAWLIDLFGAGELIDRATVDWIKQSKTVFYSWHWYGNPKSAQEAVRNVLALSSDWDIPSFATEFGSCEAWRAAAAANISHTYWHYSSYCNTGPAFGNRTVPTETFGACILGWAGGNSSKACD
eukprot:CAMPEP_0114564094 /NCGR_PEP_ID=MMETSP0114-20121206/13500_1 /TAXON_ID=31324 /ORGANISM="Goniomonas sp, Strain m" /LENGTH=451 /DNA_ID=CAMNT_0001750065 /DNA_START=33 /DNA_END=1388 /DNA_ORIENTATION=+